MGKPPIKHPHWINKLYLLSALTMCLSVIIAFNTEKSPDLEDNQKIADVVLNLNGKTYREHCTTCHPGGKKAEKTEQNNNTLRSAPHPDIAPHNIADLGCTGCHLGEGMAVDVTISHGVPGLGARDILKQTDIQASCYFCHELKLLTGAEKAWEGYKLYLKNGCDTCHYIEGVGNAGRYGPELSNIGDFLGLLTLQNAIRYPKKYPVNSIMPRFPLSQSQAKYLSYFLKSRVANPPHSSPMQQQANKRKSASKSLQTSDNTGIKLLREKKCLACHKYGKHDAPIGPDLTYISQMRTQAYINEFLTTPAFHIPGSTMPIVTMTSIDRNKISEFLAKNQPPPLLDNNPKKLYMIFCQRCHAADGNGKGLLQPNLSGFPRQFKDNSLFYQTISDKKIISSVREGIPGTSMPAYGKILSDTDIEMLMDTIFSSLIKIKRTDKIQLTQIPDRVDKNTQQSRSKKNFKKYCLRCHGKNGTGTGPEYLSHLPRPRNLRNKPYFNALKDKRIAEAIFHGIPGTAMPSFKKELSADELWNMVTFIRKFSKDDE